MVTAEQIPDEVVEAAASDIVHTLQSIASKNGLTMTGTEEAMDGFREVARAAIQAALSAWPNVFVNGSSESIFVCCHSLVLPLPQEPRDE